MKEVISVVDQIFGVFEERGASQYFGEDVSQLEHALQAALFATRSGAADSLIVAGLLHDFGHLLHDLSEDIAGEGVDTRHEAMGEVWLSRYFDETVTEPIRLHVAAKRYLCTVQPEYFGLLSPASVQSLELQGGTMTHGEVREFEGNPHFRAAVALRRFDDDAKIPGMATPGLENYRELLTRQLRTPPLA